MQIKFKEQLEEKQQHFAVVQIHVFTAFYQHRVFGTGY